jgi:hypothetical protein
MVHLKSTCQFCNLYFILTGYFRRIRQETILGLGGDKMTARLRKWLESVFNPFGFFALERHHEYLKDDGLSPTGSKLDLEADGSMFPSTNTTRNCWSGSRRFSLENGKHCHFQRPLTSKKALIWEE